MGEIKNVLDMLGVKDCKEFFDIADSIEVVSELLGYELHFDSADDHLHFFKDNKNPFSLIVSKSYIDIKIYSQSYKRKLSLEDNTQFLYIKPALELVKKLL
ncbi:hypothetical protein D3C87_80790 [compost metagenome]